VCGQATASAAIHLREEPDALTSARPGLCGGRSAMVVPTAIVNWLVPGFSGSGKSLPIDP
jgi:hypothetical protein